MVNYIQKKAIPNQQGFILQTCVLHISPVVGLKCTKDVAISTSSLSDSSCLDCRNIFDIYFEQRSKLIMTL